MVGWKGNPSPRAWWHSFGFNEKEGWREEGFSVAFAPEERQVGVRVRVRVSVRG